MRQPIAKQSAGSCPPAVSASVQAEVATAKAVALLQVLGNSQLGQFDDDELDNYVKAGLGSLAHETALNLVQAFNQLDAIIAERKTL